MKKSFIFLLLAGIVLLASCKKDKGSDDPSSNNPNDPNNPNNPNNPAVFTCRVANMSSVTAAFSYTYAYTYNAEGLVSASVYQQGSTTITKNYTYTKDANGNVTRQDAGSGNYTDFEYTNGKLSYYQNYSSNAAGYYYTLAYTTNKVTIETYTPADVLYTKTDYMLSGDNVSQMKIYFYDANGNVSSTSDYVYNGYDNKYSVGYVLRLHDPSNTSLFKNNFTGYTATQTSYDASGTVTQTSVTTSTESDYTYNSHGATTGSKTTVSTSTNGGSPTVTEYTNTYAYTNCD